MAGRPCATCGALPNGNYADGSARYSCHHDPIYGEAVPDDDLWLGDRILLSKAEAREGETCGRKRFRTKRGADKLGQDSEIAHIVGATGERAFVAWLVARGVRWVWECSNHAYGGVADIGPCQVRTALRRAAHWGTKVKRDDPLNRPVVSLVQEADDLTYTFRGWVLAGDARRDDWYLDPGDRGRPNWFVPDEALRPPGSLLNHPRVRAGFRLPPLSEVTA